MALAGRVTARGSAFWDGAKVNVCAPLLPSGAFSDAQRRDHDYFLSWKWYVFVFGAESFVGVFFF